MVVLVLKVIDIGVAIAMAKRIEVKEYSAVVVGAIVMPFTIYLVYQITKSMITQYLEMRKN